MSCREKKTNMSTGKTGECLVTPQAFTLSETESGGRMIRMKTEGLLHKYLSFSIPQDLKAPPLSSTLFSSPFFFLLANCRPSIA